MTLSEGSQFTVLVYDVQVSVSCDIIYFDGTETRGLSNVGVVVKHGSISRTVNFRVWIPQLPLDVILSDNKLSSIAGWKIASSHTRYFYQLTTGYL